MYQFPAPAVTDDHKLGGLKQDTCTRSQFWRLKAPNKGADRALLCLKPLGEDPSWPLPASGGSRCSLAYRRIAPISASVVTWPSSLCVYLCLHMGSLSMWAVLIQYDLILTNYICKDLFPNKTMFTGSGQA